MEAHTEDKRRKGRARDNLRLVEIQLSLQPALGGFGQNTRSTFKRMTAKITPGCHLTLPREEARPFEALLSVCVCACVCLCVCLEHIISIFKILVS